MVMLAIGMECHDLVAEEPRRSVRAWVISVFASDSSSLSVSRRNWPIAA